MPLMDTVKNGMMILYFKDDSPVMFISEFSDLHLGPVEPVMLSVLLGVSVLEVGVSEFTLEVVITKRNNEIEVALDEIVLHLHLHEDGFVGSGVLMLGLVMMVVIAVAHFSKRLYLLPKDSNIYIRKKSSTIIQFHRFDQKKNKKNVMQKDNIARLL
jgi:hypothetical protein